MVCTVLIWFILTVLQESSNLDSIFIVCRKKGKKISKLVFSPPPPLFFLVKSQLFFFFFNPSQFLKTSVGTGGQGCRNRKKVKGAFRSPLKNQGIHGHQ